jgi:hypothetical protein
MKRVLCIVLLGMAAANMAAQELELGVFSGFSVYSGDLSRSEFGLYFRDMRAAFGAYGRYHFSPAWALRASVNVGNLEGDDATGHNPQRGLHFRSRIAEYHLSAEYSPWQLRGAQGAFQLAPHLIAGIGFFRFNPEGRIDGEWIPLQPLGTEGQGLPGYPTPYALTGLILPIGLGVKMMVGERLTVGLELSGRKLFTDYLDDVSSQYVKYQDVLAGNGALAARLSNPNIDPSSDVNTELGYRRGGSFNDWYYMGGITLGFRFAGRDGGGKRMRAFNGCYRF